MYIVCTGMKIFGDQEAADIVFTSVADVLVVGLNVTHQVILASYPFFFIN
jgi:inosine-uridine nucleoside N-ribohydrolase